MHLNRREFLGSVALAAALPATGCRAGVSPIPGSVVGPPVALGHRLRDGNLPPVARESRTRVVIVGAGIAGLAAARQLERHGLRDFQVLELAPDPGGNSISGSNSIAEFPWAAHYVPLLTAEATEVHQLFRELGIITGADAAGRPIYREEFLCHDPMERLFRLGRWQDGLVPQFGLDRGEREEIDRFLDYTDRLKSTRGADGLRAFAVPVDRSSKDPAWTALDRQTMAAWLDDNGYRTKPLRWYVDYCCRDDFGAGIDVVSAWAGLHYFAARNGEAANAPSHAVVTWPAGNGWLTQQLATPLADRIRTRTGVARIEAAVDGVQVLALDDARNECVRYLAEHVVLAVPEFVARRLLWNLAPNPVAIRRHSPWMVANLTLDNLPAGRGVDLAWDNVLQDGAGLGYVVATHQHFTPYPRETVITYYRPLDHAEPAVVRAEALQKTHADWCELVLADLRHAHPDLRAHVRRLDVMVWGHGMATPTPGFLGALGQPPLAAVPPRVHFAHSDLSGLSLFEEAYTHGVRAADAIARQLGRMA